MSKPIYKAQERPYGTEDINDLIEKGGEGSGKAGHITPEDARIHQRMGSGSFKAIHTAVKHFSAKHDAARQYGHKEHTEHYKKLRNEAQGHMMNRLDQGTADMKKSELDEAKEYMELRKGGAHPGGS
jgi:hypothetical protein